MTNNTFDFSNQFERNKAIFFCVRLLIGIVMIVLLSYYTRINWFLLVGVLGFTILYVILSYFSSIHNQYLIDGNVFRVREYHFRKLDTVLDIPLEMIDDVYVSKGGFTRPIVTIVIEDIHRELRCTVYAKELAETLQTQIKKELA